MDLPGFRASLPQPVGWPHYNRNSLSHEPLTTFKTIAFCEVLMGVQYVSMSIAPPKKKERLPHLTASWQLP